MPPRLTAPEDPVPPMPSPRATPYPFPTPNPQPAPPPVPPPRPPVVAAPPPAPLRPTPSATPSSPPSPPTGRQPDGSYRADTWAIERALILWSDQHPSPDPKKSPPLPFFGESHECVALVKEFAGVPHSSEWTRGPAVVGNASLQRGTAIATFNAQGRYPQEDGVAKNSAIFHSFAKDGNGIVVYDQWPERQDGAGLRTISFHDWNGPSNDARQYSVIIVK